MKTPTMNTWNRHAGISIRPSRKAAPPPILPKVLRTHVSPIFTWSQVSLWTFTGRLHFFVREQILTSLMRALRSGSLAQSDSGSRRVSTCRASRPCCSALRGGLPGRQAHRSLPPASVFPPHSCCAWSLPGSQADKCDSCWFQGFLDALLTLF